jgi:hypothetical protein
VVIRLWIAGLKINNGHGLGCLVRGFAECVALKWAKHAITAVAVTVAKRYMYVYIYILKPHWGIYQHQLPT